MTVLHPGYIAQEIVKATGRPEYLQAAMTLHEWHHLAGTAMEPPEAVLAAQETLRNLKLDAFAEAGRLYRRALAQYEAVRNSERMARLMGFPVEPRTAILYVEAPKEPIELDFGYPA